MIVVVEGPSAAGKTTWCRRHAERWLPEPGRWPMDQVLQYQLGRWRQAVEADHSGQTIVLDGDPFKLYYAWAQRCLDLITEERWQAEVHRARRLLERGEYGFADLILYADPGSEELARRKESDRSRRRRNFALHTQMRPYFRQWYQAVAELDPARVVWTHPENGLSSQLLAIGQRPARSKPHDLERVLASLIC